MSYFCSILAVLFFCYSYYLCNIYSYWRRKGVVGPIPLPIVGNYGFVLLRIKREVELLKEIYNAYPNEKCIGIYMGTTPVLLVRDLGMIKEVLVHNSDRFTDRFRVLRNFKKSLFLMSGGERWQILRRSIEPIFCKLNIDTLSLSINSCVNNYLEFLEGVLQTEETHKVFALKSKITREITSNIMFGLNSDEVCKEADLEKFIKFISNTELLEILRVLSICFPLFLNFISPIVNYLSFKVYGHFYELITLLLNRRDNNEVKIDTILNMLTKIEEKDVMWIPGNGVTEEKKIDTEGVIQTASTFYFAIVDTVRHRMTNLIDELILNQHIQHKCYEEIIRVSDNFEGETLCDEKISEMKYLKMVIDEMLRKYGPLMLDRLCTDNYTFTNSNVSVEKCVYVFVPIDAIHNDAKYYINPDTFDPERFSSKNRATIPRFAYMPFGRGSRSCIGKELAKLLMMKITVGFLKKYRVLPSNSTEDKLRENTSCRARRLVGDLIVTIQKRSDTK